MNPANHAATLKTRQRMIDAAVIRHTDTCQSDTACALLARINLCLTSDGTMRLLVELKRTPCTYSDEVWPRDGQVSYEEKLSLEYLCYHKRRALQAREAVSLHCPECGATSCGC